jgi:hypothetical protein
VVFQADSGEKGINPSDAVNDPKPPRVASANHKTSESEYYATSTKQNTKTKPATGTNDSNIHGRPFSNIGT